MVATPGGETITAIRGAMIGETALFTETDYHGTALAQETTSLMRIPRHVMRRVLEEFPDTAVAVLKILRDRAETLYHDLQRVSLTIDHIR